MQAGWVAWRKYAQALLAARAAAEGEPPLRLALVGNSVARYNDWGVARSVVCQLREQHPRAPLHTHLK